MVTNCCQPEYEWRYTCDHCKYEWWSAYILPKTATHICGRAFEYSASRRYRGGLVTITNVVTINPLVTVTKGWGPNASVRVRMTLYGRRRYKEAHGFDPGNIFQCSLWVLMAQLGPILNAVTDVVFSDMELIENDH